MKLIIRIAILVIFLIGLPDQFTSAFAISGPQVQQQTIIHKKVKQAQSPKFRKKCKPRLKRSRTLSRRRHKPSEMLFGGLLMVITGVLLPLNIEDDTVGFEAAINAVFLSIVGFLAILVGSVVALIGGIMWLAECCG